MEQDLIPQKINQQQLFILNFLDIRGDNTEPAATIYWTNNQTNDLLSKKETLQQTQQVLWKKNESWKRQFYLNKDEVMLLFLMKKLNISGSQMKNLALEGKGPTSIDPLFEPPLWSHVTVGPDLHLF